MRLQESYDWVTIGDHPAALLGACIAARLGLSVLILPIKLGKSPLINKSGQILDFESNYFLGLHGDTKVKGLLSYCLNKVGAAPVELENILYESMMPTVITPHQRIVLHTTDDAFFKEMRREFGQELLDQIGLNGALKFAEKDYLKYWIDLPLRHTIQNVNTDTNKKRKAAPLVKYSDLLRLKNNNKAALNHAQRNWFKLSKNVFHVQNDLVRKKIISDSNPNLSNFFQGVCYGLLNGSNKTQLNLTQILHAMTLLKTGASFKGGTSAFRDLLLRIAKRLGAHVPPKMYCRRLFIERGQFMGIQASEQNEMIRCKTGMVGASVHQIHEKLTVSGKNWLRRLKNSPSPSGWKFTLSVAVEKKALPNGISKRCFYQEKNSPILEIEIADPKDYGESKSDHQLIFLRTHMPFNSESLSYEYQRLMGGRMLRKLFEIMPFMEFHVKKIYPDFRGFTGYTDPLSPIYSADGAVNELSEVYGFATPELIPDYLRCFDQKGIGSRSGLENLYVANDESYPELGSLGGVVAAIEAVSTTAHKFGLNGPFVN
jgi:hypothetical protein